MSTSVVNFIGPFCVVEIIGVICHSTTTTYTNEVDKLISIDVQIVLFCRCQTMILLHVHLQKPSQKNFQRKLQEEKMTTK